MGQAAKIEFKKPAHGTIKAKYYITREEIDAIQNETDRLGKNIFDRTVDLFNDKNEIAVTITKTLYVRKSDLANL